MEVGYHHSMFGVCYANKFEGMLKLFEIDPGHTLIDYTRLTSSSTVVPLFLEDFEENRIKVAKYLPLIKEQTLLNGSIT